MSREFIPSPQQAAVFAHIDDRNGGNAIVEAVAGAGKTTTIVHGCERMTGSVFLGAYNTAMGKELKERTSHLSNVRAGTFHSAGMNALRRAIDIKGDPDGNKVLNCIDAWIAEKGRADLQPIAKTIASCVSMAKQRGIGILFPDTDETWLGTISHFGLDEDLPEEFEDRMDIVIKLSRVILQRSNKRAKEDGYIDFDDMIYLPLLWNLRVFQNDWVLTDESQDLNPTRRALARKMLKPHGRLIAVGDKCQPPGTFVTTSDGAGKNIEKLVPGDRVRTFSRRDSSFVQSGRAVIGVTERPYNGPIITVVTGHKETEYTEGHYCYAKLKGLASKYSVYLMRKNDLWRVGTSLMQNGAGVCGPMSRKRLERADDVWLLKLFDTEREAKAYEFKVATEYGVPELLFRSPGSENGQYWGATQRSIDLAWLSLNKTKLGKSARKLLKDHGRSFSYPINETASRPGEFWVTRPIKIRASNLMDGMEVLHYRGKAHYSRDDFEPIKVFTREYNGLVYSLDVEKDHTYIADGIATFNCQSIYGFSGSDNDSMERIERDFNCKTLPLTVTYRCPKAVVKVARQFVSHIEAHESAPEGLVVDLPFDQLFNEAKAGDAILCRYNKFLVTTCFKFIRNGVPARIEGRAIGANLISLINKWKTSNLDVLQSRVTKWADRECEKNKKNDTKIEQIRDRAETVMVLIDRAFEQKMATKGELIKMIQDLFDDRVVDNRSMITLCSAHRAKGKEWDRVFILGLHELMGKECNQEWQTEQERHLQYVAVTRSKNTLFLVTGVRGD